MPPQLFSVGLAYITTSGMTWIVIFLKMLLLRSLLSPHSCGQLQVQVWVCGSPTRRYDDIDKHGDPIRCKRCIDPQDSGRSQIQAWLRRYCGDIDRYACWPHSSPKQYPPPSRRFFAYQSHINHRIFHLNRESSRSLISRSLVCSWDRCAPHSFPYGQGANRAFLVRLAIFPSQGNDGVGQSLGRTAAVKVRLD